MYNFSVFKFILLPKPKARTAASYKRYHQGLLLVTLIT